MALSEGSRAPNFSLPDKTGRAVSLSDLRTPYVVVFFYPKDNTPGCTTEAKEFSESTRRFESVGATILGISGGDQRTKTKFCEKHDLSVLLLSDSDFAVAKDYGVYGSKSFMGKSFLGIHRVTFVLDEQRNVIRVFDKVRAAGHAQEVLEWLQEHGARS